MNELKELHLKGVLAGKGLIKETFDNEANDLKHELTELGRAEIREILKDPEMKREYLKMAIEEAKKYPNQSKAILLSAINKMKELQ
jgi:hypothetical protein